MTILNEMIGGSRPWNGAELVEAAAALPTLAERKARAFGMLDGGYENPAREAAMKVLGAYAEGLKAELSATLPTVCLREAGGRRVDGVISGTGPEVEVSVVWTLRREGLTERRDGGGSLSASYGEAIVTTPAGSFPVRVSNRGTSSGYARLADADAWNQCLEARASVGL
jgi:hypothetical protein